MLTGISNTPRDYAWGSTSLIADLEGRTADGRPEAEVWFGDHAGSPALTADGTPLPDWRAAEGEPERLPYLLKLLAAASPLSIQAHPSKAQAEVGFAREEAAGIDRDAPERTYRDDNHKPELIVAIGDSFTALAGLRELEATRRLLAALGDAGAPVAERLSGADAATALRETIAWLLSGDAHSEVDAIISALPAATSDEFDVELDVFCAVADAYPADPGVVVALLMNVVLLAPGEGVFVPAGVLHAYLEGLGVEIMAASDNVLRGGLTPKHIDVAELLDVLDTTPGPAPVVLPVDEGDGISRYRTPVADFVLRRVEAAGGEVRVPTAAPAIALCTAGEVAVAGARGGGSVALRPGEALYATADEEAVTVTGRGEVFVAQPAHSGL
ncbi:mannose-6-phosphate isomerase, class I [Microbacterium fluvii]|uniref:mannose-6-phosphate isomerase n=1 Tax=Microbacterium fluvii TaxID=415215 RepID=A0ABW2HAC5_9MICO|nr:mannose-6-phosphate isomerase, class I [Microbacterium fluvii]MCU4671439.1 mannose-6-phosphate isomerase, class I [Microbacterium fluvii]